MRLCEPVPGAGGGLTTRAKLRPPSSARHGRRAGRHPPMPAAAAVLQGFSHAMPASGAQGNSWDTFRRWPGSGRTRSTSPNMWSLPGQNSDPLHPTFGRFGATCARGKHEFCRCRNLSMSSCFDGSCTDHGHRRNGPKSRPAISAHCGDAHVGFGWGSAPGVVSSRSMKRSRVAGPSSAAGARSESWPDSFRNDDWPAECVRSGSASVPLAEGLWGSCASTVDRWD